MMEESVPKNSKNRTLPRFGKRLEKSIEHESLLQVIGALETAPTKLRNWLKQIGIETLTTELQKTVLLHLAQILQ